MTLDKDVVLPALYSSWEQLDEVLSALTDEQWQAPSALPGWNVQAVVAHVIGTESFLQGIPVPEPDCDVSALPHVHNPIGVMNECWVRHLRDESPQAMIDKFRAITAERRAALAAMPDEAFEQTVPTPVGPDTYTRFMRVRTFDCWLHLHDISGATGVVAGDGVGPAGEHSLDEIQASLGYIVGKRGKAPDGSRVEIVLTGPLQRTLRVAVDGRARLVDEFDGPATATVTLDGVLFTRLAGGRTTAAEHADELVLGGDVEVAQRVAENLTFVM